MRAVLLGGFGSGYVMRLGFSRPSGLQSSKGWAGVESCASKLTHGCWQARGSYYRSPHNVAARSDPRREKQIARAQDETLSYIS